VNPGAEDLDQEIRRFEYKLDAGAEFIVTRPVFDERTFDRVAARLEASGLPVLLGVRPLESVRDAEYMANEISGVVVPAAVLDRMARARTPEAAAAEGIGVAKEVYEALRGRVQGVLITAPPERVDRALEIVS
jgi:homocysteine S-methyltransferase